MPELPEVETIVQSLRPHILGREISGITVLLPKIIHAACGAPDYLIGRTVTDIFRQGKTIIIDLSDGWHLRIHLKMTGQLLINLPGDPFLKHTHVVMSLDGNELELRYRDIRQFGFLQILTPEEWGDWLGRNPTGPDPLEISLASFSSRLGRKKGRIKSVLLDQTFLGGLGNIYIDEILHQARIHPETSPVALSAEEIHFLYHRMQAILKAAIQKKGSSVRNYTEASGQRGQYQTLHQVYGRYALPCRHCGTLIAKTKVAGRGTCFCPQCQKKPSG
ncbi:MAG: bifunctional DNA-formamidopyrimidine glycosylase/DNA-(apurinic or apyrimidinic site) lyase [bacterium]